MNPALNAAMKSLQRIHRFSLCAVLPALAIYLANSVSDSNMSDPLSCHQHNNLQFEHRFLGLGVPTRGVSVVKALFGALLGCVPSAVENTFLGSRFSSLEVRGRLCLSFIATKPKSMTLGFSRCCRCNTLSVVDTPAAWFPMVLRTQLGVGGGQCVECYHTYRFMDKISN